MKKLTYILLLTSSIYSDTYIKQSSIDLTHEKVKISSNENLGLVSLGYLLNFDNSFYAGARFFGAVSGKRGGFFTAGIDGGYKYYFTPSIFSKIGTFVGGGGGGSAPQGGGLMIKPYLELLVKSSPLSYGISFSKVKFPNGDIDSNQIGLVFEYSFNQLFLADNLDNNKLNYELKKSNLFLKMKNDYYKMIIQNYHPKTKKNLSNQDTQDIKLIGFEYGREIKPNFYGFLQSSGAFSGGADGYAEVLLGGKYFINFANFAKLSLSAGIGSGGGGRVNTGGGSLYKLSSGVEFNYKKLTASVLTGYISSFNSKFRANTATFGLGYKDKFSTFQDGFVPYNKKSSLNKWSIKVSNKTYNSNSTIKKNGQPSPNIQLLGFKINRYLTDNFYLSGQAFSAYKGKAGGYATGLFGVGYNKNISKSFYINCEALVGAGGGGGIATGGAMIYQGELGVGYKLNKNLSLETMLGKVKAKNGTLDTNTAQVALKYNIFTLSN